MSPKCEICESFDSSVYCEDCEFYLCSREGANCDNDLHSQSASMVRHRRTRDMPMEKKNESIFHATLVRDKSISMDDKQAAIILQHHYKRWKWKNMVKLAKLKLRNNMQLQNELANKVDTNATLEQVGDCGNCEQVPATVTCADCELELCSDCSSAMHKSKKRKSHHVSLLRVASNVEPGKTICSNCEKSIASVNCPACNMQYCKECNIEFHKIKAYKAHVRYEIHAPTPFSPCSPIRLPRAMSLLSQRQNDKNQNSTTELKLETLLTLCSNCESAPADKKCIDCAAIFCISCDEELHSIGKFKNHIRSDINENTKQICQNCEFKNATKICKECDNDVSKLCTECDEALHSHGKNKNHIRSILTPEINVDGDDDVVEAGLCSICEEEIGIIQCNECDEIYCAIDDRAFHKKGKAKTHHRSQIQSTKEELNKEQEEGQEEAQQQEESNKTEEQIEEECAICEEPIGIIYCKDCECYYCEEDDKDFHMIGSSQSHIRIKRGEKEQKKLIEICMNCDIEYGFVYCNDCKGPFCRKCNIESHSIPKLRHHIRKPLPKPSDEEIAQLEIKKNELKQKKEKNEAEEEKKKEDVAIVVNTEEKKKEQIKLPYKKQESKKEVKKKQKSEEIKTDEQYDNDDYDNNNGGKAALTEILDFTSKNTNEEYDTHEQSSYQQDEKDHAKLLEDYYEMKERLIMVEAKLSADRSAEIELQKEKNRQLELELQLQQEKEKQARYEHEEKMKLQKEKKLKEEKKQKEKRKKKLENNHNHHNNSSIGEDMVQILKTLHMYDKYYDIFVKEDIRSDDLISLSSDRLKILIPQLGPRTRLERFIRQQHKHKQQEENEQEHNTLIQRSNSPVKRKTRSSSALIHRRPTPIVKNKSRTNTPLRKTTTTQSRPVTPRNKQQAQEQEEHSLDHTNSIEHRSSRARHVMSFRSEKDFKRAQKNELRPRGRNRSRSRSRGRSKSRPRSARIKKKNTSNTTSNTSGIRRKSIKKNNHPTSPKKKKKINIDELCVWCKYADSPFGGNNDDEKEDNCTCGHKKSPKKGKSPRKGRTSLVKSRSRQQRQTHRNFFDVDESMFPHHHHHNNNDIYNYHNYHGQQEQQHTSEPLYNGYMNNDIDEIIAKYDVFM